MGPLQPIYDRVAVNELQLKINTMEFRTEADVSYKFVVPEIATISPQFQLLKVTNIKP
jgi:hypothetical protein